MFCRPRCCIVCGFPGLAVSTTQPQVRMRVCMQNPESRVGHATEHATVSGPNGISLSMGSMMQTMEPEAVSCVVLMRASSLHAVVGSLTVMESARNLRQWPASRRSRMMDRNCSS